MALSTHELYLVLRARDEASGILRTAAARLGEASRIATAKQIKNIQMARDASARAAAATIADLEKEIAARKADSQATADHIALLRREGATARAEISENIAMIKEQSSTLTEADRRRIQQLRLMQATMTRQNAERIAQLQEERLAERDVIAMYQERVAGIKEIQAAEAREASARIAELREMAAAEAHAADVARAAASRRMAVGTSVITSGVMATAAGAIGLAGLFHMTSAAAAYKEQVAQTKTQTDHLNVSMAKLSKMGIDVGNHFAVAFDQIQPSLYDIFSSIDTNAPGAAKLLRGIALAAVAGKAPMETTGRALLTIMNAYKMNANQINHVNDEMFQLVRKGVGTYQEFTSVIGRAIPSAISAGQSLETVNGMLAFLTRNGLSAAMASSSVARALDSIANPKSQEHFRAFGVIAAGAIQEISGKKASDAWKATHKNWKTMSVDLLDAQGKMKPMTTIVHELNTALKGMTREQKAATMKNLFTGAGGTIQAMRFWNHALNDTNNLLGEMTNSMRHANGAARDAYKIMQNTPEAQVQILKNRFKALEITIGNDLIPVKLALLKVLVRLVGAFNSLSPQVKRFIAYAAAAAAAALTIGGVVAAFVGLGILISGALTAAGASLASFAAGAIAAVPPLAAIGLVAYEIYKHWDGFVATMKTVWGHVQDLIAIFVNAWNQIYPNLKGAFDKVSAALDSFFHSVGQHKGEFENIWNGFLSVVKTFASMVVPLLKGAFTIIGNILSGAIRTLGPILHVVGGFFSTLADLWGKMPSAAQHVVVAMGIIMFAMRGSAAMQTAMTGIGVSFYRFTGLFSGVTSKMGAAAAAWKNSSGKMMSALAGITIGNVIGTLTAQGGQLEHAVGFITSVLAGAAVGWAIGGPIGAAIGGVTAAISSVISMWQGESDAAKQAAAAAKEAAREQRAALVALEQQLESVKGAYNNMYKAQVVHQVQSSSNIYNQASRAGVDPKNLTNAILGIGSAYDQVSNHLDNMIAKAGGYNTAQGKTLYGIQKELDSLQGKYGSAESLYQQYDAALGKAVVSQKQLQGGLKNLNAEFKNTGTAIGGTTKRWINGLQYSYTNTSAAAKRNTEILRLNVQQMAKNAVNAVRLGKGVNEAKASYDRSLGSLKQQMVAMGFSRQLVSQLIQKYRDEKGVIDNLRTAAVNYTRYQRVLNAQNKELDNSVQHVTSTLKSNKGALMGHTDAAKADRNAVARVIDQIKQHAATLVQEGHSAQDAARWVMQHVGALVQDMRQAGASKQAVQQYLHMLGLTPKQQTTVIKALTSGAWNTVSSFRNYASQPIDVTIAPHVIPATGQTALPGGGKFQHGTNYAPGGMSLVGEKGPEYVVLPRGARVLNNATTTRVRDALSHQRGAMRQRMFAGQIPMAGLRDFSRTTWDDIQKVEYYSNHPHATHAAKYVNEYTKKALLAYKDAVKKARQSIRQTDYPNLMSALLGSPKDLRKAIAQLRDDFRALEPGSRLLERIGRVQSRLLDMQDRLGNVNRRLKTAQGRLGNLRSNRASLASTVAGAVQGTFGFSNEFGSFQDIAGDLGQANKDADTFKRDIKRLARLGYSDQVISALYSQGPAALPTIESLLTATKPQARAFSKQYGNLQSTGRSIGQTVAGNMYDAGIQTARGVVEGLRKRRHQIIRAMRSLVRDLMDAINQQLDAQHNPSHVAGHNGHGGHHTNRPNQNRGPKRNVSVTFEKGAIVTQELNPVKHAHDLGWEIARRIG